MQTKKKNMNKQFEYIRAFAIVAVITIHTFYSALCFKTEKRVDEWTTS